jgi:hypothetical protein
MLELTLNVAKHGSCRNTNLVECTGCSRAFKGVLGVENINKYNLVANKFLQFLPIYFLTAKTWQSLPV